MKILFVTPYLPAPPDFGGARRMYALVRGVGRHHEVVTLSLVAPGDDVPAAERALGRVVPVLTPLTARQPPGRAKRAVQLRSLISLRSFQDRFYRVPALQHALDRLTARESFDLVQFEFSQMGAYRLPPGLPSILDVHNIEHDLLRQAAAAGALPRRLFNQIEYRKFLREEIAAWRRATACIATSEADATRVRAATGGTVRVVPNGVDVDEFAPSPLSAGDPESLVFVGAMRYGPNADAALWFVRDVWPRVRAALPSARVALVGADPPQAVSALSTVAGVTVTGSVPDVRPWLGAAGVVVVPLRSGGGTRLKILEAFAAGRPVVSTTIGASGLDVRDGEHLLLADTPATFAGAIVRLTRDTGLSRHLVDSAATLVHDRYRWSAIVDDLDALYGDVVDRELARG